MKLRIAINGFGRIGRMVFRRAIVDPAVEIVAINATYPAETLAHLIKYDTIQGFFDEEVIVEEGAIRVNGQSVRLISNRNPIELPWGELNIDVVVEATGKFRDREGAALHIKAGAKKVVITAPGQSEDATIVMGVNHDIYDVEEHDVISNASCTTNCLAPIAKVLHDRFEIHHGLMTTVHSYTNDQNNLLYF